jgi:hypothetical protein
LKRAESAGRATCPRLPVDAVLQVLKTHPESAPDVAHRVDLSSGGVAHLAYWALDELLDASSGTSRGSRAARTLANLADAGHAIPDWVLEQLRCNARNCSRRPDLVAALAALPQLDSRTLHTLVRDHAAHRWCAEQLAARTDVAADPRLREVLLLSGSSAVVRLLLDRVPAAAVLPLLLRLSELDQRAALTWLERQDRSVPSALVARLMARGSDEVRHRMLMLLPHLTIAG